jgi:hypothetical protein
MLSQPDDATCGPTCLHAVYSYYGDGLPLSQVVDEIPTLEKGGTLGVSLAAHALTRGYRATLYTYNLLVFDPTWFAAGTEVLRDRLALRMQARGGEDPKLGVACEAYLRFLTLGGRLRFEDLTSTLIRGHLKRGVPILTGLSATYLYRVPREVGIDELEWDDVNGDPTGHFVVLSGYDPVERRVKVSDPIHENPTAGGGHDYWVSLERLICAILIGVLTYDANLLILEPPKRSDARPR